MNIEEIKAKYNEAFSCGDSDRMWDSLSDIPTLIAEVERLTKEYREQDNAHHKLFMDFCNQQKQIATLKKALELAIDKALPNSSYSVKQAIARNLLEECAQQTHETQEAEK